jgi:predicted RNase H-like nuclease (RuvC/YqgF family)
MTDEMDMQQTGPTYRELEREVEEKQAYCVWADKRIGDLEHEVERLQEDVANREAHHDKHHREVERLRRSADEWHHCASCDGHSCDEEEK